jgi:uncharacterized membrane protein
MEKTMKSFEKKGKSMLAKVGSWSFILGVLIALIVGIVIGAGALEPLDGDRAGDTEGYIATILVVLGVIVGLVGALGLGTITKEEMVGFLVAAIALVAVGLGAVLFEKIPLIGDFLSGITGSMLIFFAPAAVILAIRYLWDVGRN